MMDWKFTVGIGFTLVFGFLPFAVKEMPQWLSWGGFSLGLCVVVWAIASAHHQLPTGPIILGILAIALFAGAIGWFRDVYEDSGVISREAIAQLSELGWSVKPQRDGSVLFEIANGPLPSVEKSAQYFRQLVQPFTLHLQAVTSLAGLHFLADISGCSKIEINAGEFNDLSELQGFTHLTSLIISQLPLTGSGTVNVAALGTLNNLRLLNLNMVKTRDIASLASLRNLTSLNLGGTFIGDVSPLAGMAHLVTLEIRDTRVTDLSPLANNHALRELVISNAQLRGLPALQHLQSLKKISLIAQEPVDLGPLAGITGLEELWIWCGQSPVDLAPLAQLKSLRSLTITGGLFVPTPISHVEVVSDMSQLRSLTVGYLQIADLAFLSNLRSLEELNLNSLPITSIAPLAGLVDLRKIVLVNTQVVDVSPLLSLPALTDLTVGRTPARNDVLSELGRRGVKVNTF